MKNFHLGVIRLTRPRLKSHHRFTGWYLTRVLTFMCVDEEMFPRKCSISVETFMSNENGLLIG